MKKRILSLAVACITALSASAQSSSEYFNHLGVSVDLGLIHGVGINVTAPVIDNTLYLSLGGSFPSLSYNTSMNFSAGEFNSTVDQLNQSAAKYGISQRAQTFNEDISVDANAKLKLFNNFKLMLQYFPFKKSSFHISAGLVIGGKDFLTLSGDVDDDSWAKWKSIRNTAEQVNNSLPAAERKEIPTLGVKIDETAIGLNEEGNVDASLSYNAVKPYIGIGFGRAIPKKRVGFQFEIGTWYNGTPKITTKTPCEDTGKFEKISGVTDYLGYLKFIPTITFRLTGRIF